MIGWITTRRNTTDFRRIMETQLFNLLYKDGSCIYQVSVIPPTWKSSKPSMHAAGKGLSPKIPPEMSQSLSFLSILLQWTLPFQLWRWFLSCIQKMTSISHLDLSRNALGRLHFLCELGLMSYVTKLALLLYYKAWNGTMPSDLGRMTSMTQLNTLKKISVDRCAVRTTI
jgi:hypothetical protein